MIVTRTNERIAGEVCDVHSRLNDGRWTDPIVVEWCGVYVHPVNPVPGYWYFPEGDGARELLTTLGVLS